MRGPNLSKFMFGPLQPAVMAPCLQATAAPVMPNQTANQLDNHPRPANENRDGWKQAEMGQNLAIYLPVQREL